MQITVTVVTLIALLSVIGSQFKLAGLNAIINFLPLSEAEIQDLNFDKTKMIDHAH